jgi:multidrug resistance protein
MSDDARHSDPDPDPRTSWTARRGPLLTVAVIVGISPFATDLYIPALPAIATDLGASTASVQLTLTAFLVAFAVGQLVIGPISDGVGRRRILLAGTALFTLASVVCAISPDVTTLILARVVQGLGGAAAAVSARAMVGDASTGTLRSRLFATLAVVNSVGPVVAPLVGGLVLTFSSWRAAFVVLAVLGLALTVAAWRLLPELGRMAELLRIPRFRWYLVTGCTATIGFFSYIATSSFVFQEQYGFGEGVYTLVFASNASCMIASTLVFRRLVVDASRYSAERERRRRRAMTAPAPTIAMAAPRTPRPRSAAPSVPVTGSSSPCATGFAVGLGAVPAGTTDGADGAGVGVPGVTGPAGSTDEPASSAVRKKSTPTAMPDSKPRTTRKYLPGWREPFRERSWR